MAAGRGDSMPDMQAIKNGASVKKDGRLTSMRGALRPIFPIAAPIGSP